MKERKASWRSIVAMLDDLDEPELLALADNPQEVGKLARELVSRAVESIFFSPVSDKDLAEELCEVAAKWRRLAAELGYAGPIAWKVKAGFTLKQHAPKAGPCEQNFAYLQDWRLQNDEPTKDSIVFFIPRLLPGSTAKTVDEQRKLLSDLRARYDLPETHLASFGSAALLAGLILAHFKITGERVPQDQYWTRTDTLSSDDDRLSLGVFDEVGLNCGSYSWGDNRNVLLGCFALGV
jgi:hypothetical protein